MISLNERVWACFDTTFLLSYMKIFMSIYKLFTSKQTLENLHMATIYLLKMMACVLPWRFWSMDQLKQLNIWNSTAWSMFALMFIHPKLKKQLMSPLIYVLIRYGVGNILISLWMLTPKASLILFFMQHAGSTLREVDE